MAVETRLRKVPFDSELEENITQASNDLIDYQIVSTFLSPIVDGEVYLILVFQKR